VTERKPTWEDVAAAAAVLADASAAFARVVRRATDNPALIAAAEHIENQGRTAAAAGNGIAGLVFKIELLADFESGRVIRNPATP
jgi:divalent metal cation (Fe/Co/Zn/Cd) transporter